MNFLSKIKFIWKKPKMVIIAGEGRACAKEAIEQVLRQHFKVGKEIFVFEADLTRDRDIEKFKFLLKNSSLPVLVVTHFGALPTEEIRKLAKILPPEGRLILNFDDETVRKIKNDMRSCTFGFGEGADFRASDVNLNSGTNFKVNERGNVVPVWLEKLFGKEQIYSALAAAAVGNIFGLNLVEISQALKNYQPLAEDIGRATSNGKREK